MLVLTRKPGQEIIVPGANIRITVLGTKGNAVRLGITAPRDVPIHRKEIWDRLCPVMDAVAMIDADAPAMLDGIVRPK